EHWESFAGSGAVGIAASLISATGLGTQVPHNRQASAPTRAAVHSETAAGFGRAGCDLVGREKRAAAVLLAKGDARFFESSARPMAWRTTVSCPRRSETRWAVS